MQRDLHATHADMQFMIAVYFLGYGTLVITGGRIGDRLGRRNTYAARLVLFAVASTGCGLATNPTMLLVFRVGQGVVGALYGPQGLGMVQTVLPPERRARAFAAVTVTLSLSRFLGPVIGGIIINANVWGSRWRPIFLINPPR